MAELASVVDGLGSPGRIRPGRTELLRPEDKVKFKGVYKGFKFRVPPVLTQP
jgi:hypothetical protein